MKFQKIIIIIIQKNVEIHYIFAIIVLADFMVLNDPLKGEMIVVQNILKRKSYF